MIYFLKGIVRFVKENIIVLEVNNIGYEIYVINPNFYHIDDDIFLYTYQIIKEDNQFLIGFNSYEEKEAFLMLIKVSGIGPKGAINILKQVQLNDMIEAISSNDVSFFKSLNGVNSKTANQIILDLKTKIKTFKSEVKICSPKEKELKTALTQLGFKTNLVEQTIIKVNLNKPIEEALKEALSIIRKL